jgi:hypothetical protein
MFLESYHIVVSRPYRRILDIGAIEAEVQRSNALLFNRSEKSRKIAQDMLRPPSSLLHHITGIGRRRHLPGPPVALWLQTYTTPGIVHLKEFHYYRPRLAYLQEQMKAWRPRKFSELFIPGYYDRLTWFTAIFGLVFGIIATLSLVTSIIQVVFAVLAWKATK